MPFIGKDWRSPGEQWVKTHKGSWERLKLLDNASKFLGFQSSDSSLDSDSSISDNENCPTFMDSECSSSQQQHFEINITDALDEKSTNQTNELTDNLILEENVFSLNSNQQKIESLEFDQQFKNNLDSTVDKDVKMMNDDDESFREPMKCISNNESKTKSENNDFTITEFNSTIKGTKNTSIQNIISKYEQNQQQQSFIDTLQRSKRFERQSSFDEVKINPKHPLLKSTKQRHLFPSKSIDQPMFDFEQNDQKSTSKFSYVKENLEKLLNPTNQVKQQKEVKKSSDSTKIAIHDKIEKPTKHLTIKQCIRKIDLNNTTHQSILKHIENDISLNVDQQSSTLNKSSIRTNKSSNEFSQLNSNSQPHCPIILKHTKEIAGYNTISDAFFRLDFCNAIRDVRRFNYVCKLLHLLITQNLTSLSGCATKFLFNLLEEIAFQVAGNQQNIHILHTLLRDVQKIMKMYVCWGRPLGSTVLWETHLRTIENICQIVKNIEIKSPPGNGKGFRDLPAELIRTILLQLSDYKDLMNSGQVNNTMKSFLDEQHIWRELSKYHFKKNDIKAFLKENQGNKNFILERPINEKIRHSNADNLNWEKVFHSLRKKFGLKEEYADSLFLCRHCRSLFWKQLGHPCLIAQMLEEMNKENTDAQFISNENSNNETLRRPNQTAQSQLQQPIRIQERIQQIRPMINPLINNQIDLNRQINNLNRVNNIVNNEIRQANNEENRFVPQTFDSVPITPEAFLKFFSL